MRLYDQGENNEKQNNGIDFGSPNVAQNKIGVALKKQDDGIDKWQLTDDVFEQQTQNDAGFAQPHPRNVVSFDGFVVFTVTYDEIPIEKNPNTNKKPKNHLYGLKHKITVS